MTGHTRAMLSAWQSSKGERLKYHLEVFRELQNTEQDAVGSEAGGSE